MTRQQRFAIVGAGQAGLPLALSLLARGAHVTLVSNRSADEIREGDLLISQDEFDPQGEVEPKAVEEVFVRVAPVLRLRDLRVPARAQARSSLVEREGRAPPSG